MKQIVTIDLNFMMAPSWSFYGDKIREFSIIEDSVPENNFLRFAPMDVELFAKVVSELILPNADKVRFLKGQEDVLHFLKGREDKTIINIDYNSDIEPYELDTVLSNLNWISYGLDKNIIDKVIWIHPNNSNLDVQQYKDKIDTSVCLNNAILTNLKPDEIYIAVAREWILPQYQELIGMLECIVQAFVKDRLIIEEEYPQDRLISK